MIAIIDYRAGNIASVSNALARYQIEYEVTNNKNHLNSADGIIFPGVGHAASAMEALNDVDLVEWLKATSKPVLGICLGMQLFYESTEEGETETLGIIPGRLKKFDASQAKVPHMGWNTLNNQQEHPVFDKLVSGQFFYFVHSYYAPINEYTIATSEYIHPFAAAVAYKNYTGVQFHPEKSGKAGAFLLQNFLNEVYHPSKT